MKQQDAVVAYIALGSNEGDRLAYLRAALEALASEPGVSLDPAGDVASLYETRPVGGPAGQGDYLNTCVRVHTRLAPHVLLGVTQRIETALGRLRRKRWGPRTIDLDLLLFGDVVLHDAQLTLPHPRIAERRFVLEPLAELAADLVHPVTRERIAAIAARQRNQPLPGDVPIVADRAWYARALGGVV